MAKENAFMKDNWIVKEANAKDEIPQDKAGGLGNLGEIVVGKRIEEFFSEVSVAGLKYVVITGAMYFRKAIWLLCVLGGLGFMIFQFHDRISYFLSHPTTISVKVENANELEFPTVTICNENKVSRTFADLLPGYTDLITNIYPPWPNSDFKPNFAAVDYLEESLNISDWGYIWLYASPFINYKHWEHCAFNGQSCNLTEIKLIGTTYGFCLQFNGENVNYTVSRSGNLFGLWMLLNISQNDYMYANSRAAGVTVTIHEKHVTPAIPQYGIKATPGSVTSIGLNKKVLSDLPDPYTNCSDEDGYSKNRCAETCYEDYIIQHCKCRMYYFRDISVPTCDPEEMHSCVDVKSINFTVTCDCPDQCQLTKYIYTISSAASSDFAMEYIAQGIVCSDGIDECEATKDEIAEEVAKIRGDMLEIQVYFKDLQVEEVKMQMGYSTLALLCDIGGALGLILGATILTVFEIIDFALVLLYDWIRYKLLQRQAQKVKPQKTQS